MPVVASLAFSLAREYILGLKPGWADEDDSKAISEETFERALHLVHKFENEYTEHIKCQMPLPRVSACTNGSIDIYWSTPLFGLLINVKPDPKERPTYFCDQGCKFEKIVDKFMGCDNEQ